MTIHAANKITVVLVLLLLLMVGGCASPDDEWRKISDTVRTHTR